MAPKAQPTDRTHERLRIDQAPTVSSGAEARTGVVLAAGLGTRLRRGNSPTSLKPLAAVGEMSLIFRTLRSLERAGCGTIVVVLGYHADELRDFIRSRYRGTAALAFVTNRRYHLKNGLSLLCARDCVSDVFVLTMADHVLGDELMELARKHIPPPGGATLLVDHKLESIFDMDDATKVLAADGKVVEIGKQLEDFNCVDTGVFVCTRALIDEIEQVYHRKGDASLSEGVAALARRGRMEALDIGDGFWQDVDTPEMLAYAEDLIQQREPTTAARARKAG